MDSGMFKLSYAPISCMVIEGFYTFFMLSESNDNYSALKNRTAWLRWTFWSAWRCWNFFDVGRAD